MRRKKSVGSARLSVVEARKNTATRAEEVLHGRGVLHHRALVIHDHVRRRLHGVDMSLVMRHALVRRYDDDRLTVGQENGRTHHVHRLRRTLMTIRHLHETAKEPLEGIDYLLALLPVADEYSLPLFLTIIYRCILSWRIAYGTSVTC